MGRAGMVAGEAGVLVRRVRQAFWCGGTAVGARKWGVWGV